MRNSVGCLVWLRRERIRHRLCRWVLLAWGGEHYTEARSGGWAWGDSLGVNGWSWSWATHTLPWHTQREEYDNIPIIFFSSITILSWAILERKKMTRKGIEVIEYPNIRSTKARTLSNLFLLYPRAYNRDWRSNICEVYEQMPTLWQALWLGEAHLSLTHKHGRGNWGAERIRILPEVIQPGNGRARFQILV